MQNIKKKSRKYSATETYLEIYKHVYEIDMRIQYHSSGNLGRCLGVLSCYELHLP